TVRGDVGCPDYLQQGGRSGFQRERCHYEPVKLLALEAGVKNYAAGRPLDATGLEWGRFSETGTGVLIDAAQAYLRVNEICGLFLNYHDSHTRLAGLQLDLESA